MLANYLIGLREGLEAALVVTILIAYVVKVGRRDALSRIWAGVGLAVLLALGIGALLSYSTYQLSFQAQETLGGTLSILATGLVTWMVFWMLRTARSLKGHLHHQVDRTLAGGVLGLVFVAFLAVGREGIETALFLWAAVQATGQNTFPLLGAALGILTAVALGWLIYAGMLRINLAKFFTWTGGILIIVAAGVLSYGFHDLQEAGILPGLHALAFDVSGAVPPDSWYGTLLKGTLNFSPATTWLELGAWVAYTVPTMTAFILCSRRRTPRPTTEVGASAPLASVNA
ncbi:iron uptake transporter permease EfeU [Cryobacterium tepidiphilum]|uniref:High-affinity Fe2+/Pb2+ permease n=1 Tax=Cryobacterium tepidiphilum TaxID=2486026 RepID=A0A3M8LEF7_9MICO|nr:iron uptake transporter permease EfeU [Cryobacterium tepidiphilum]RNE63830.1 high-affinity Fe2+/Pb2+ permease [Cryobacterium tepidiphilum]